MREREAWSGGQLSLMQPEVRFPAPGTFCSAIPSPWGALPAVPLPAQNTKRSSPALPLKNKGPKK